VNLQGQHLGVYQSVQATTADPARLVVLLFDGAIRFLRQAAEGLDRGEIDIFATRVSRAQAIIAELSASLDHEAAGDLGASLARLYDFMGSHLTRGLIGRNGATAHEVIGLLQDLREGFEGARARAGGDAAA
jgi:flagellar protein FliS